MALEQRIVSLQKRHSQLQTQIEHEESRPAPDTALIGQLKREKLAVKEEVEKLQLETQAA